ncbi:MAG: hypothetical protein WB762_10930 [Candidatus Sulfotelmatobacter sp.]
MAKFLRRYFWLIAIPVYWLCAFWLLASVFRITADGSGPTATFYWGDQPPTPTLPEYYENLGIRLRFLYPYWIAAAVITELACGVTARVVFLLLPKSRRVFLASFVTCLLLLLLAQAISDIGTTLHLWRASMMYISFFSIFWGLKAFIPLSLLAGCLALARSRLYGGAATLHSVQG